MKKHPGTSDAILALFVFVAVNLYCNVPVVANDALPQLRLADRVRIAEAFRIADQFQNELWAGWSEVPFTILLVTPEQEFLIRHPEPTQDFTPVGFDSLLDCEVWQRDTVFGTHFLATFPAVNDVPTVVIGQPEHTGKSSTAWTMTLLHEHFHQLQNSTPGYYQAVNDLDLAGDDRTGMWMLNYPFPYEAVKVGEKYRQLCDQQLTALRSRGTPHFPAALGKYLQTRELLTTSLASPDQKYLSFQLWQEGVARYTEYRMANLAAALYEPTAEFCALDDYTTLQECANQILDRTMNSIEQLSLADYGRVAFYSTGAGDALLLDEINPQWRSEYFTEWFALGKLFPLQ